MSHAYAARGARQTAVIAAIIGLHFAAYLAVTAIRVVVEQAPPEPPPVRLLPPIPQPLPKQVPPAPGPADDVYPERYPEPVVTLPTDDAAVRAEVATEGKPAVASGSGPYVEEIVPPSLRTRPARVAMAINACYPAASRRMNEEGTVVALVTVGADGKAANWRVAQSSGFARLDAAVACVLSKLEFVAGRRDGQAVSMEAQLPITFRLD